MKSFFQKTLEIFYFGCMVFMLLFYPSCRFCTWAQGDENKEKDSVGRQQADIPFRLDKRTIQTSQWHMEQNANLILYSDSKQSKELSRVVLSASERIFPKMEQDFGIILKERIAVFLISSFEQHSDLPFLNARPEWASGSAYPPHYLIVIRTNLLGKYPEMDITTVFAHELSHTFLYHALKDQPVYIPAWFNEGVAMLEAKKWGMRDSYELASTLIVGRYIPLRELRGSFPREKYEARRAYVESFSFLTYLAEKYGEGSIWRVISKMKEGHGFDESFFMVFGQHVRQVEEKWVSKVTLWFRWIPVATSSITLWIGVTLLFIFGYVRKKSREKKTLRKWDEEDRLYP